MTTDVEAGQSADCACDVLIDVATAPTTVSSRVVRPGPLRRLLRLALTILTAQYTLIAVGTGLSVAATVKYVVSPQVMARFEAISTALKR
ncbi:MAG: hypothetical protein HY852_14005 [Bradyrhizobium sp.]|uniref:hypothetical protein n=1 Tax=Bradyrhizobium sp. TaxID=376 RepID=UPI0025BECEE8|nr:hypothetical protein [Bradyrhizobium sp.]MBI5262922.1 hypothetical protein [Bradyrhizobium sp.]